MEKFNQKKEASIAKAMKAMKIKDSKVGTVILKDNVFEESKLGNKLGLISHIQSKEHRRIMWEREQLLSKQRKRRLCKSYSSSFIEAKPQSAGCMFPSIDQSGARSVVGNCQSGKAISAPNISSKQTDKTFEVIKRTSNGQDTLSVPHSDSLENKEMCDNCDTNKWLTATRNYETQEKRVAQKSTGPSKKALRRWKRAVAMVLTDPTLSPSSSLPALLSPMLLKRAKQIDGTKDPRFAQLVDQLVPNLGRGRSLKYSDQDLLDEEGHDRRDVKAFKDDRKHQAMNQSLFKLAQQAQLYKARLSSEPK